MYPDPHRRTEADDLDAATRREFFGPGGRRAPAELPPIVPIHGNGFDTPFVPDATTDSPLNTRHHDSRSHPISDGLASQGRRMPAAEE
jgi:hypothetical protein